MPRLPVMKRQRRSANGIRQITKMATLVHLLMRSARTRNVHPSMVLLQIHSVVEAGDLIAVAVEHESGAREDFAEAALLGLAPARMIDIRIDVGVETIFRGRVAIPGRRRLLFLEADLCQGLDALIAVLPGNNHANRRAILRRKTFTVHADAKKSERVHGFIEAQALDIGEIDAAILCLGHLSRVIEGFKGDVPSFRRRFDQLCEDAEGKTDPGHNDGPALHATMAVDALFERS